MEQAAVSAARQRLARMAPMDALALALLSCSEGYQSILFNAVIDSAGCDSTARLGGVREAIDQYVAHVWGRAPVRLELRDGYLKVWPDWAGWHGFRVRDLCAIPVLRDLLTLAIVHGGFEHVEIANDICDFTATGCHSNGFATEVVSYCRWAALETALYACQRRLHDADHRRAVYDMFCGAVYALHDPFVYRDWCSWGAHHVPCMDPDHARRCAQITHEFAAPCRGVLASMGLTPRSERATPPAGLGRSASDGSASHGRNSRPPKRHDAVLMAALARHKKQGQLYEAECIRRQIERLQTEDAYDG